MYVYCGNNPVNGYDPTGHWDWGGVLTGLAITAIGVGLLALTVATAGAATPLVAAAVTSIGTGVAAAAIGTGVSITTAAATDSAAVLDVSYTCGRTSQKYGSSVVIDYGKDTAEFYSHYGVTSSSSYACSYGSGMVFNYKQASAYGGDFIDLSVSGKYSGLDYGLDICFDPGIPSGSDGTAAFMGTVGVSFPSIRQDLPVTVGYDHYIPYAIISW